jgi:deazaflavin-dependent oxidoreductase (nitroreductase family)
MSRGQKTTQTTHLPSTSKISKAFQRFFMRQHVFFYRLSGGRFGGSAPDRSFLILTTTGRKSGQERPTPLFYFPDGDRFIVIASNWGSTSHPVWWLNLQTHPQAKVQIQKKVIPVIGREADPTERKRLWAIVTTEHKEFADYQKKIEREIPVVILTPEGI